LQGKGLLHKRFSSKFGIIRAKNPLLHPQKIACSYTYELHLHLGLPDAFCKNTGHFDLSTVPDLSCVVFRKQHRYNRVTVGIVKQQLLICLYLAGSLHFSVCVGRKSHQGLRQQQQINFTKRTVLRTAAD